MLGYLRYSMTPIYIKRFRSDAISLAQRAALWAQFSKAPIRCRQQPNNGGLR
jgi:hypothetical protein